MRRLFSWAFFDLDGTLIDHFAAIHEAYRSAQEHLGLPAASYEKVRRTVGGSVPVTMRRLVGPEISDETIQEAIGLFDQRFLEIMFDQVEILPGVPDLLKRLQGEEVKLAVFTNKKGEHARPVLDHLGLSDFFEVIAGAGDTAFRKPEPEFTDHVLATTGAGSGETLLVGDSPFDVEAGKVRELAVAAVATGSHTAAQLRETRADWVFADSVEILERIRFEETGRFCLE